MNNRKLIIITVILLGALGILMIFSSSYIWAEYKYGNEYKYLINQTLFFVIGLGSLYLISKIDYNIYKRYSNIILIICLILLCIVLIPGIGVVRNGSRSWFQLAGFGIQPSELSKIGLIIFVSKYLEKNNKYKKNTTFFILPVLMVIIVFLGLIMLEPDFGTAMVILMSLIGLLFVSGANFSIFIKLGIVGIVGIVILILMAPYRLDRITSYLNPWNDPLGSGFQIIQSLYAIGPGGLLGHGLFNSRQKYFYLPEPHTDFIFSIILEELGFLGAILTIGLYVILFYKLLKSAIKIKDLFGKYLIFGLTFSLLFQTILNMCVITGISPITGVTLPFLSYGGSSLLVSMTSIGIITNILNKNS